MQDTIIFDLDGTLASNEWRVPLARAKRWPEFHQGIPFDAPILGICQKAVEAEAKGQRVVYVTNRMDDATTRHDTLSWLLHNHLPLRTQATLFLRAAGDVRLGSIIKAEQLDVLRDLGMNPVEVYEDHPKIIPVWQELGLEVHVCKDPVLEPLFLTKAEAKEWLAARM